MLTRPATVVGHMAVKGVGRASVPSVDLPSSAGRA